MFLPKGLCPEEVSFFGGGGGPLSCGLSVRGITVQGGLCPVGYLSGGSLSRRSLSRGVSVQGRSVQRRLSVQNGISV